ncbi:MAG TPA: ABC transporter ATP-binding protein [Acidimicrobiales bacterium]|nr:ABC transporter ATP-binding protein [Acidimicrobiales bacterium]
MTGSLSLERVTVRYGTSTAVSELTESVGHGEWVGLVGPNGAGKTTLLRSIARLVPHEGKVAIGDADSAQVSRRQLARLVAYVPQRPTLPSDMAVSDYVLLGRTPHIGYFSFESSHDRRVCSSLLERLDLSRFASRRLGTLSGGELQRLVLARALAQEAPVLLLDEPTSELDLGRRVEALELVDELRREHGLTVVSALHDLTLAGQFADRLVLLAAGKVAAAGSPAEVLKEASLGVHFGTKVRVLRTSSGELVVVPQRTR